MRFLRVFPLMLAMLALCSVRTFAQLETASIVGTVTDSTGAVVVGVKVTATNVDTGVSISRISGNSGQYVIPALHDGTYRVVATMNGFETSTHDGVHLLVGTNQQVNFKLVVGAAQIETITVDSGQEVLETETSHKQQVVTTDAIENFPLQNMNYSDLLTLSVGISQDASGQDLGTSSVQREGSYIVTGQRPTYNNYLLDGMDNNAHGTSNQGFSNQIINASTYSISQFAILTTLPPAEYGRSAGGTINVAFKQGTNKYHGQMFETERNTITNANGFFKATDNSGRASRTTINRHQFGANLGGPILRDKFFFFADYEGLRSVRQTVNMSNIFKLSDHALIVSPNASAITTTVQNPFTGDTYAADRPLPRSVLSPIALAMLDAFPLPNNNGAGVTSISSNYSKLERFTNSMDKMDVRLDMQWTPRMSSFARVSHSKEHDRDKDILPAPFQNSNGYIRTINQQVALGFTRQVRSTALLEGRLGISYTKGGKHPDQIGDPRTFGFKGLPTDPDMWGGPTTIDIDGYGTFGRQSTNPQWQYPAYLNPKITYAWLMGRHNFKTGYEFNYLRQTVMDVNPVYGQMSFYGSFSGYIIGDYLFGAPDEINLTNYYVVHIRQGGHAAFIQDDWKILPYLTLNLGLRYEYASHFYEKDGKLTNYDPTVTPYTGQMIKAKMKGSAYDRQLVDPDFNDFMPRIGFALSARRNLVFHGGFGVGFVHYTRSGESDNISINGPQWNQAVYNQIPAYPKDADLVPSNQYYSVDDGYPDGMASPLNFNLSTSKVKYIPRNYRDPYVENWYFGFQYGINSKIVADVSYIGNHGVKQQEVGDPNQRDPDLGYDYSSGYFKRPHENLGDVLMSYNGGTSNYNGLTARLEMKKWRGIWLLNAFTYSRSFANVTDDLTASHGFSPSPQDYYHQHNDYGPSQYDIPVMNNTALNVDLPIGRKGLIFRHISKRTNNLISGWKLTLYNQYRSGYSLTPGFTPSGTQILSNSGGVKYRPYFAQDENGQSLRSVAIKRLHIPGHKEAAFCDSVYAAPTMYGCTLGFSKTNPAIPDSGDPLYYDPRGDVPNGLLRGDNYWSLDAGLDKSFRLPWHKSTLHLRGQFYNVLNRTNFTVPGMTCCSTSFGRITNTYGPGRIGQVQARITF